MKRLLLSTITCLFLLFSVQLHASPDTVEMQDDIFVPDTITITEGDTIIWVNTGNNVHTATSGTNCTQDGYFDSGNIQAGGTYMFEFDTTGEIPYYCIPHCQGGMTGHITVESAPVGIDQPETGLSVSVYPNPVGDQLRVELSDDISAEVDVNIYDLQGREVLNSTQVNVERNELRLDTSPLENGMYIMQLTIDGQNIAVKKINKL